MSGFVLLLHAVGWTALALVSAGHHDGARPGLSLGVGITAYTLGMRHAFDADHVTAIDNVTRKLTTGDRRPLSVGFWFSLGHSSVVFVLSAVLAAGAGVAHQVSDGPSTLHRLSGVVGTSVSATFVLAIGLTNLAVLIGIVRAFRGLRTGSTDAASLGQLNAGGLLSRVLGRYTRAVGRPWHMYPVGLLFGLGFDTATEVGLLILAGTGAAAGMPWYAVLALPVLFAAGMSLFDTADGVFMVLAYGWALARPVRRVFYNMTVTGLSVAVALAVGSVELLTVAHDGLHLRDGLTTWASGLDLNALGYAIVGAFAVVWLVAFAVYRLRKVEERWTARLAGAER
jgi:high-affinity nickel-transport protein